MINSIHTWNSTKEVSPLQLIRYVNQSMKDDYNTPQLFRNIDTPTIQGVIDSFKDNDKNRLKRKKSVAMYHEILSVSKGSDSEYIRQHPKKLQAFMQAYMDIRDPQGKAMGYGKVHFDRENVHIHIVWHGVQVGSSKTLRMEKAEFNELRYRIEEWHMKHIPELKHSIVHHDLETGRRLPIKKYNKGKSISNEFRVSQNLTKEGQLTHKAKLQKMVEKAYKRSSSKIEFEAELLKEGIQFNYRGNKETPNGIRYNNKSYKWETVHSKEFIQAFDDIELQRQRKRQLEFLKQQKFKDRKRGHSFNR